MEAWKAGDDPGSAGMVLPAEFDSAEARDEAIAEWQVVAAESIQAARLRGDSPGFLREMIANDQPNQRDLRDALSALCSERMDSEYRLLPPRRRYLWMDTYMSSLSSPGLPKVVIGIDTSGSVSSKELSAARAVINGVLEDYPGTNGVVVQFDIDVNGEEEFYGTAPEFPDGVIGRGGTSFVPFFSYIEENHDDAGIVVVLTDAIGGWPERPPDQPVVVGLYSGMLRRSRAYLPGWERESVPISVERV